MKASSFFMPTLKESSATADKEPACHELLGRAGFLRRGTSGVFAMLPLGQRTLRKISASLREVLDSLAALEMAFPSQLPPEADNALRRFSRPGAEPLRFKDRKGREASAADSFEEYALLLVGRDLKSYGDENLLAASLKIHDSLTGLGIDCLVDDRQKSPGFKFKDADLIGYPFRVNVGRRLPEGLVEIVFRSGKRVETVKVEEVAAFIKAKLGENG